MENQGGGGDPSRSDSWARGEVPNKGKEKEATFAERLQASGRMALNSVVGTQPPVASLSNDKSHVSATRGGSSVSDSALGESSRTRVSNGLGGIFKKSESSYEQASAQYERFLSEPQVMQDSLQKNHDSGQQVQNQSFREQAAYDGAEVVHLLSMQDGEPNYSELDDLLSEQEAVRIREALFNGDSSQPSWDQLLNFSPDFNIDPSRSQEARAQMGTEDTAVANAVWLQQWQTVLTSYTEEVWGDLGLLVKQAQHEIEEIEADIPHTDLRSPESKALDRLRQILAHVRGQL